MRTLSAADRAALADPLFAERYRQVAAREVRHDGRFFTGVRATGVFCRPGCAVPVARPDTITFFSSAAAAHAAGLRPCPRCRPDATSGSPQLDAHDGTASRALRLIADGAIERSGVAGLAATLGITSRHLLRAVEAEAGAGPLAIARTARAHLARQLLEGTGLAVKDVAVAAGFASIRQFNDTISALYHTTPTALRRESAQPESAQRPERRDRQEPNHESTALTLTVRLPVREPFEGRGLLRFLRDRAIVGVERGDDAGFARTVRLPHGPGWFRVTLDAHGLPNGELSVVDSRDVGVLLSRVRRLFDLDADPVGVDQVLTRDPVLERSVAAHQGIRVPGAVDAEEMVFRALIGQQISVAAARTSLGRLAGALGEHTPWGLLFPTAAAIAEGGRAVMRGPEKRIDAIVGVAEALAAGRLAVHVGCSRSELTAALTSLPGIGPWTAGYVALRVLGSPDVLLTSDLGIRNGARALGLPAEPAALSAHSRIWAPWRSYAGMHVWLAADG